MHSHAPWEGSSAPLLPLLLPQRLLLLGPALLLLPLLLSCMESWCWPLLPVMHASLLHVTTMATPLPSLSDKL